MTADKVQLWVQLGSTKALSFGIDDNRRCADAKYTPDCFDQISLISNAIVCPVWSSVRKGRLALCGELRGRSDLGT